VFKVKIIDKSDLKYAEIRYVQNGKVVTQGLVRDPNDIYKVLMDARSPYALIVINAVDINGNKASVVKELNVTSLENSILSPILNLFFDVGKTIVSVFTPTKH
jgi:predicted transcriptional regulator